VCTYFICYKQVAGCWVMANVVMALLHHGIFFGKRSNGPWGGGTTEPQFDNQPIT
jgi:hypothetical protein